MSLLMMGECAIFHDTQTAQRVSTTGTYGPFLASRWGHSSATHWGRTLLGQLGRRADDVVMWDGLALATDDFGGDFAPACSDSAPVEAAEFTLDECLDAFVAAFGLTERERDILEVLVVSDQSVQDIAATLFLSRSTLYRHISSINKKTGTTSRVALINFFWSWTPKD